MRHSLHIAVGPARFRIGSAWPRPIAALRRLYARYPQDEGAVADFTVRLDPAGPGRRWWRSSVRIAGDYMLPDAAPMALAHGLLAAEMGMNLQMALGWRRHVLIHASAVERDGRALMMCGESGSGKSTLAAMLAERGWRFLGDEFALLDPLTGALHPFPRPVSLKNAAIDVMRAWVEDDSRFGPVMRATPKGDIAHLVPAAGAIERMTQGARPALLLFPQYGVEESWRPMDAGEAFVRLTQASTNYVAMGERGFDAFRHLLDAVPVLAFGHKGEQGAVDAVEHMWAELT